MSEAFGGMNGKKQVPPAEALPKSKTEVLREMQDVPGSKSDSWTYDGVYEKPGIFKRDQSYNATFAESLKELGHKNLDQFVEYQSEKLGHPVKVLDLFGGAYFLGSFDHVSKIVGVRLKNVDENLKEIYGESYFSEETKKQIQDPKREILEGNLYEGSTWRRLREENQGEPFDLIVCRPQGPFGHTPSTLRDGVKDIEDSTHTRESVYAALLTRSLDLLSPDGGTLFTQTPNIGTEQDVLDAFWDKYIPEMKAKGYEFLFDFPDRRAGGNLTVIRHPMPKAQEEVGV